MENNKQEYEKPTLELISLIDADVVTDSIGDETDDEDLLGWGGL